MASSNYASEPSSSTQFMKEYKWFNSYSLPLDMQCVIIRAEISEDINMEYDLPSPLCVEVGVVGNQMRMLDSTSSTLFSQPLMSQNIHFWGTIVSFPVKIRDLPLDAVVTFTVRSADGKVVCGSTMRLFDATGALKQGKQKLMLFYGKEADSNVVMESNDTPGEYYDHFAPYDESFLTEKRLETFRTSSGQGNLSYWLDKLLIKQVQEGLGLEKPSYAGISEQKYVSELWGKNMKEYELKRYSYLIIELPTWQFPVLYEEKQYPSVDPHYPPTGHDDPIKQCISEQDERMLEFSLIGKPFNPSWLTVVADWDMDEENLAEEQNRRLAHNVRKGSTDATAKPNKDDRKRIDRILQSVGNFIPVDDMDFLYRFRYSLTDDKKALIKFLYTVNWEEESEVAELPILLALWKEKAPIDVADALKLLSKEKSFEHQYVREFAVSVLRSASDEELLSFLLQLVQALRYEPVAMTDASAKMNGISSKVDSSDKMTEDYADTVEVEDFALENSIVGVNHVSPFPPTSGRKSTIESTSLDSLSPLGKFLVDRACCSPVIANYLYWYLKVEMDEEGSVAFFTAVHDAFIVQLSTSSTEGGLLLKRIMALENYIQEILSCQREAIKQGRKRGAKLQLFIKFLQTKNLGVLPNKLDWVPLPLDPLVKIDGMLVDKTKMFASAVYPCLLEFSEMTDMMKPQSEQTETKAKVHKVIFKSGDDLRQDQLIMQMISLMDSLLKKVNLDLKLLTYGILAVSQTDGIMEFVRDSMPISAVEREFGSIAEYLKKFNYDCNGDYEISPVALDTFVKSCAGCCVISYILGIGDRHLDNIMITTAGQLFHIDFGFIFGRDPKPFPPPFRFTRLMADAMGGEDSEHYARFKTYCCQSYNWLRKSVNLILNLLSLMGDAGISDISKNSDLPRVLLKVEERFRLDLSDEQAEQYFLGLINESLTSIAPKLMEIAHKIAVAMR